MNLLRMHNDDSCYKYLNKTWGELHYHRKTVNFFEAENHCRNVDRSELAIIKDQATLDRLIRNTPLTTRCFDRYYWIGLRKEGYRFKWTNGDKLNKSFINVDNNSNGPCVSLLHERSSSAIRFIPKACNVALSFVCFTPRAPKPKVIEGIPTPIQTVANVNVTTSPQHSSVSPATIGLVAALLAVLLLTVILVVVCIRSKKQTRADRGKEVPRNVTMDKQVVLNNEFTVYSSIDVENQYESAHEINPIYNMDITPAPSNDCMQNNKDKQQTSDDVNIVSASDNDVTSSEFSRANTSDATYAVVNKKTKQVTDVYSVVNKNN
ncbi:uncharacterized protein LOC494387 [Ciona intestinalis]